MDNLLELLRRNNIFGSQGVSQAGDNSPLPTAQDTGEDANVYTPQTTASNAYSEYINQMPKREDYRPGALRKISAVLAGMGSLGPYIVQNGVGSFHNQGNPGLEALKAGNAVRDEPYNQAMQDWTAKGGGMKEQAVLEGQQNTNERMAAYQAAMANAAQQRAATGQQNANTNAQYKQAATEARLQAIQVKIQQGAKPVGMDPETGFVIVRNLDGSTETLENVTPVAYENTLKKIASSEKIAGAHEAGANSRTAATIAGANQRAAEHPFGYKPPSGQALSTEAAARVKNFLLQNPGAAKFVNTDATGRVVGVKPDLDENATTLGVGYSDTDKQLIKQLKAAAKIEEAQHGPAKVAAPKTTAPKASEVPATRRVVGQSYLMSDGTTKLWTGNPNSPWR